MARTLRTSQRIALAVGALSLMAGAAAATVIVLDDDAGPVSVAVAGATLESPSTTSTTSSSPATPVAATVPERAPGIEILSPAPGTSYDVGNAVSVTGRTEVGAALALNGDLIATQPDGSFSVEVTISSSGVNTFTFTAQFGAGPVATVPFTLTGVSAAASAPKQSTGSQGGSTLNVVPPPERSIVQMPEPHPCFTMLMIDGKEYQCLRTRAEVMQEVLDQIDATG